MRAAVIGQRKRARGRRESEFWLLTVSMKRGVEPRRMAFFGWFLFFVVIGLQKREESRRESEFWLLKRVVETRRKSKIVG